MTALDRLVADGRVPDAGLDAEARAVLRAAGARRFHGPGPAWWAVGERRRLGLVGAAHACATPRPDPDAAAFDGP